jgi:hypothetical protein
MPLSVKEFLERSGREISGFPGVQKCVVCLIPLQETITGNRPTAKGNACSNCYFDMLGEEIEKNPICMPRKIRG